MLVTVWCTGSAKLFHKKSPSGIAKGLFFVGFFFVSSDGIFVYVSKVFASTFPAVLL